MTEPVSNSSPMSLKSYMCHSCHINFSIEPNALLSCPNCFKEFVEEISEPMTMSSSEQENNEEDELHRQRVTFQVNYQINIGGPSGGNVTFHSFTGPSGRNGEFHHSFTGPGDGNREFNHSFTGPSGVNRVFHSFTGPSGINGEFHSFTGPGGVNGEFHSFTRPGGVNGEFNSCSASSSSAFPPIPSFFNASPHFNTTLNDTIQRVSTLIEAFEPLFQNDQDALWSPLPTEQIEALPIITLCQDQIEKEAQCSICMDDFVIDERVKGLPCQHFFHDKCITTWLQRQGSCPNCREKIQFESSQSNTPVITPPRCHLLSSIFDGTGRHWR